MEGYTLVITEKPEAASRIAHALDFDGAPRKRIDNGVPFYVARRDKEIVIVPALGHLYTVGGKEKDRSSYPVFEYKWVPFHVVERKTKNIRSWIAAISKLAANADAFIDACDFDIEGSLVGFNILKFACKEKENFARRMKYSTLTKGEIERAFLETLPTLDFCLIESGLTRHEVDWLYGINLSRALTAAAKKFSAQCAVLSAGRVQGPTLRFVATRERSIRSFVPTPYWTIKTFVSLGDSISEVDYEKKRIDNREEGGRVVRSCVGKIGKICRIENTEWVLAPPPPFDLSELQSEAYKIFRYLPRETGRISQRLYLHALISYPRTSSQKLSPTIGYRAILKRLLESPEHRDCAADLLSRKRLKPTEGKGIDPAHPAIYPTGNLPEKFHEKKEWNIWNLVVRRFISSFGAQAKLRNTKATIRIEGHNFYAKGVKTLDEGWIRYYKPYTQTFTKCLPTMKENEFVEVIRISMKEQFTLPPPRYNPSTILKKMQKEEIGTKATRAGIVQTLYNRKYIREKTIRITDLGFEVVNVLMRNCPTVASPRLTRNLEEKMIMIQQGKVAREEVIGEAIETLKPILEKLKQEEQTIGRQLSQTLVKSGFSDKTLGKCPNCKTGKLIVVRSKKTRKRFIGCTQYFEGKCKTSFSLPQQGFIKPSVICRDCGWLRIRIQTKGKSAWDLCFNPECPQQKKMKRNEV